MIIMEYFPAHLDAFFHLLHLVTEWWDQFICMSPTPLPPPTVSLRDQKQVANFASSVLHPVVCNLRTDTPHVNFPTG